MTEAQGGFMGTFAKLKRLQRGVLTALFSFLQIFFNLGQKMSKVYWTTVVTPKFKMMMMNKKVCAAAIKKIKKNTPAISKNIFINDQECFYYKIRMLKNNAN